FTINREGYAEYKMHIFENGSVELNVTRHYKGSPFTTKLTSSPDTTFTTGTLKEGKFGVIDYAPGSVLGTDNIIRSYGAITAFKFENEERGAVCYEGKRLELRSDGCFREGAEEASWARLAPTGFLPFAQPGGLEGQPMRGMVIPTRGDFIAKADVEKNFMEFNIHYRPGYLYTSGPE